jgi:hypothetical protein
MEYLYYFENASLTLRVVDYLCGFSGMPGAIVTVIHQMDGALVKVKMNSRLNSQQDGDFRAYLNELGIPEEPSRRINMALVSLSAGQSPIDIMRRYQVVVVFHGSLQSEEITALRQLLF